MIGLFSNFSVDLKSLITGSRHQGPVYCAGLPRFRQSPLISIKLLECNSILAELVGVLVRKSFTDQTIDALPFTRKFLPIMYRPLWIFPSGFLQVSHCEIWNLWNHPRLLNVVSRFVGIAGTRHFTLPTIPEIKFPTTYRPRYRPHVPTTLTTPRTDHVTNRISTTLPTPYQPHYRPPYQTHTDHATDHVPTPYRPSYYWPLTYRPRYQPHTKHVTNPTLLTTLPTPYRPRYRPRYHVTNPIPSTLLTTLPTPNRPCYRPHTNHVTATPYRPRYQPPTNHFSDHKPTMLPAPYHVTDHIPTALPTPYATTLRTINRQCYQPILTTYESPTDHLPTPLPTTYRPVQHVH